MLVQPPGLDSEALQKFPIENLNKSFHIVSPQ